MRPILRDPCPAVPYLASIFIAFRLSEDASLIVLLNSSQWTYPPQIELLLNLVIPSAACGNEYRKLTRAA